LQAGLNERRRNAPALVSARNSDVQQLRIAFTSVPPAAAQKQGLVRENARHRGKAQAKAAAQCRERPPQHCSCANRFALHAFQTRNEDCVACEFTVEVCAQKSARLDLANERPDVHKRLRTCTFAISRFVLVRKSFGENICRSRNFMRVQRRNR
jgi:hypothetical protein